MKHDGKLTGDSASQTATEYFLGKLFNCKVETQNNFANSSVMQKIRMLLKRLYFKMGKLKVYKVTQFECPFHPPPLPERKGNKENNLLVLYSSADNLPDYTIIFNIDTHATRQQTHTHLSGNPSCSCQPGRVDTSVFANGYPKRSLAVPEPFLAIE